MNDKILEEVIKQAMMQGDSYISFGWQGGEPTLMGVSFFEKVVKLQQQYGRCQTVGNGLQTNGILLDEEWAKFLRKNNFLVGISLDGPKHIHDYYRLMQGGQGSWDRVVDNTKLLLDNDVAVNTLSVISDYSVNFPEEIYEFHKSLGLNFMQFIPIVETDPEDHTKAAPFSVSPEKYGSFLCKLFDLWRNDFCGDSPMTSIRYFDSVFYTYVGLEPPECTLLKKCGVYLVIEHNGDVYPCDFFVEPKWKLGNVMNSSLIELLNSERQNAFGEQKANLSDSCKGCKWLSHCFGGCIKDRIRDPMDNNTTHFCISYKMFFKHANKQLREMAENWKRKQNQI